MRKQAFVALALVAVGCSSSSPETTTQGPAVDVPTATPSQLRAFDRLTKDTSRSWTWIQHETFKTPMHLSAPRVGAPVLPKGGDVAKVTHEFLARYRDLFRMTDPSSELRLARAEVDEIEMTHARFQQHVRGVPVVGAELAAHFDPAGRLASIDANYIPDVEGVDLEPKLDAKVAADVARQDVLATMPGVDANEVHVGEGKLVVFALNGHPATLAYEVTTRAMTGEHPAIWVTTIDAKSGRVIDRYDNLQTIEATGTGVLGDAKKFQVTQSGGTYVMTDTSRGVSIRTYTANGQQVEAGGGAQQVTSTSLTTWDTAATGPGAAVDAHVYAGVVYDYYKTKHGRNAIDGQGGAMLSTAHYGQAFDNAAWDGTGMIYGDGGRLFKPLSAGLDVVAHEFTHGVTERTSGLRYQNQTGALNESVSDIFGVFIEHSQKPSDTNNWIMGESIAKGAGLIRDFKNPAAGRQPANMSAYVNTQQDNGGVHINSGIPNNAMFLMTVGGTNPVSKTQVAFGIGWEKSEKVWYRTNTKYLLQTSTFAQAAQATMQAAKDLQLTDNEQNIIDCAWKATGVVQGTCATITNPQGTTPPTGTPGDPNGDGTGNGTGDGAGDGTGDGTDGTGDGTGAGAKKPKRGLSAADDSSGCNLSSRSTDLGPLAGVAAAVVGLALGRRRRRR